MRIIFECDKTTCSLNHECMCKASKHARLRFGCETNPTLGDGIPEDARYPATD